MVSEMNASLSKFNRGLSLSLLALSLSSCSLFRDGKYASQWEIQSDVPASLNSGEATAPSTTSPQVAQVKSNLSGTDESMSPDAGMLDLPATGDDSLIDVPKPDFNVASVTPGQSPVELLNIPSAAGSPDVSTETLTNADLGTLLPAPPPAVTEEELAMAPAALPPGEAAITPDESIPPAPPAPGAPAEEVPTEGSKSPVKTASSTTIPLLYGQLDLSPYLPQQVATVNEAPLPPPGE